MVSHVLDPGVVHAIPIHEAEALAERYKQRQILIFTFDGEFTGVTTWGATALDSAAAAEGGNLMKRRWGWPENTIAQGAKVQALYNRIAELEKQLDEQDNERRR